jgi:hypothetical protein
MNGVKTMERAEKYQNKPVSEHYLNIINDQLLLNEINVVKNIVTPPKEPVIFIIGAPRSGTTLLHQLLASTGEFGYITNFIARFWNAPYLAAKIQETLPKENIGFESDLGRTDGLFNPHHFSRFWRRWIQWDKDHQINFTRIYKSLEPSRGLLKAEVSALEHLYNKPMLFRSQFSGMVIPFIKKVFPTAKFVICNRKWLYQAQSILLARKKYFGSYDGWFSLKPPQYHQIKDGSAFQQVADQIYFIHKTIDEGLRDVHPDDYIKVNLEDIWLQPQVEVLRVVGKLLWGVDAWDKFWDDKKGKVLANIPKKFKSQNMQKIPYCQWKLLLDAFDVLGELDV